MSQKALVLFSKEVFVAVAVIVAVVVLIVININPAAKQGSAANITVAQPTTTPATTTAPQTTTSVPETTVPTTSTTTTEPSNGLKGEYFSNIDFSGDVYTRTDPAIDMEWLNKTAPIEGINGARFSARWTGKIMIDKAGDYMFVATSDDGSRLYIDGTKYADLWDNSGVNSRSSNVALTAGKHDIKIEYKNLGGGKAKIKLEYLSGSLNITRQVVPIGKLSLE